MLTTAPDVTDPSEIDTEDPVIVVKAEVETDEDTVASKEEEGDTEDEREFAVVGAEEEEAD